jgi:hypothetical protein
MIRRITLASSLTVLLLGSAVGCGDGGTAPDAPDCVAQTTITVSAGTQPTISWTPTCRAAVLRVSLITTGSTPRAVWQIGATEARNVIEPGVRYGDVPSGTAADHVAEPLVAGATYSVSLNAVDCRAATGCGSTAALVGTKVFTP